MRYLPVHARVRAQPRWVRRHLQVMLDELLKPGRMCSLAYWRKRSRLAKTPKPIPGAMDGTTIVAHAFASA